MNYKYPPIYKYILLLILFTTFLKYYKVITKENYLLVVSIFVYMVFVFDYMLIDNHPNLFDDKINNKKEKTKKNTKIYVKKKDYKKPKDYKKIKVIDDTKKSNIHIDHFTDSDKDSKDSKNDKHGKHRKDNKYNKYNKYNKDNEDNEDIEMYNLDKELEEFSNCLNNKENLDKNIEENFEENLTDEIQKELDRLDL